MQDEFKERSAGTIELGKAMTQDSISIAEEMTGTGTPRHFMLTKGQSSGQSPGRL
jgi:hypothetical protein